MSDLQALTDQLHEVANQLGGHSDERTSDADLAFFTRLEKTVSGVARDLAGLCRPPNPNEVDTVTAALVFLARQGIPTDIQGLLVEGNPSHGIAPNVLLGLLRHLGVKIPLWVRKDGHGTLVPPVAGWYRVMIAGHGDSVDGVPTHDCPDIEIFAQWDPAEVAERSENYRGSWICSRGEDSEDVFAYCGPMRAPDTDDPSAWIMTADRPHGPKGGHYFVRMKCTDIEDAEDQPATEVDEYVETAEWVETPGGVLSGHWHIAGGQDAADLVAWHGPISLPPSYASERRARLG